MTIKVDLYDRQWVAEGHFGDEHKLYRSWIMAKPMYDRGSGARTVKTVGNHAFYAEAETIGVLTPSSRGNAARWIEGTDVAITMTLGHGPDALAVIARLTANQAEDLAVRLLNAAKELRAIELAP